MTNKVLGSLVAFRRAPGSIVFDIGSDKSVDAFFLEVIWMSVFGVFRKIIQRQFFLVRLPDVFAILKTSVDEEEELLFAR